MYTVTYDSDAGCTSAESENHVIDGIGERTGNHYVTLFPNPTSIGKVYFQGLEPGNHAVSVISVNGRIQTRIISNRVLKTNGFVPGVYMVEGEVKGMVYRKKLLIN